MRISRTWMKAFAVLFGINLVLFLLILGYTDALYEAVDTWWSGFTLLLVAYAWPLMLRMPFTIDSTVLAKVLTSVLWLIVVPAAWATIWWGAIKLIRKLSNEK